MKIIAAQGELRIYKINAIPEGIGTSRPEKTASGQFILAHSEKGHHHVLGGAVDVLEHVETKQVNGQSIAMRTLYAIVEAPTKIIQTSLDRHADIALDEGYYAIKTDVEFNPFAQQIQQIKD
jgi:hypothetical protein